MPEERRGSSHWSCLPRCSLLQQPREQHLPPASTLPYTRLNEERRSQSLPNESTLPFSNGLGSNLNVRLRFYGAPRELGTPGGLSASRPGPDTNGRGGARRGPP